MERTLFDAARYLSMLPLLSMVQPTARAQIAARCTLQRLASGELLFPIGTDCQAFYVVVTGQVRLFVHGPTGQEKVIEIIGPNSSFGEAVMFMGIPSVVNAQALGETLLLKVGRDSVLRAIECDVQVAMAMLAGMSRRLHGLVCDVQGYTLHSGRQRLIGYLLRLASAKEPGGEVSVQLGASKAMIASRLSLTPQYFSRVLQQLQSAGLIEVDKRTIRLLDLQRLTVLQQCAESCGSCLRPIGH